MSGSRSTARHDRQAPARRASDRQRCPGVGSRNAVVPACQRAAWASGSGEGGGRGHRRRRGDDGNRARSGESGLDHAAWARRRTTCAVSVPPPFNCATLVQRSHFVTSEPGCARAIRRDRQDQSLDSCDAAGRCRVMRRIPELVVGSGSADNPSISALTGRVEIVAIDNQAAYGRGGHPPNSRHSVRTNPPTACTRELLSRTGQPPRQIR